MSNDFLAKENYIGKCENSLLKYKWILRIVATQNSTLALSSGQTLNGQRVLKIHGKTIKIKQTKNSKQPNKNCNMEYLKYENLPM